MRILPNRTQPPQVPIGRRHDPKPSEGDRGYRQYRSCLRWDFGFTCPFCLLHEADFVRGGRAEGTGLTSIEHFAPQSRDAGARNEYSNCFYCCRFCNGARSNTPIHDSGRSLLDPTQTAWSDHFELTGDELTPRPNDVNAEFTHETYDLDDPRKSTLRRLRFELYADHLPLVTEGSTRLSRLLSLTETLQESPDIVDEILACVQDTRRMMRRARADLATFASVPADAPRTCRCEDNSEHQLPVGIASQSLEIPEAANTIDEEV